MRVFWSSRQGLQRKSNSDALTLGRNGQLLVCLLVDAAERTPASREFARHWGQRVVPQVLAGWNGDDETILALLQQEQRTLRHEFLLEVASYCLLCLDTETATARTCHAGDCLAGERQGGMVLWWTSPHTLGQEPYSSGSGARHLLTRSLSARRFHPPELQVRQLHPGNTIIMATDGYWAECLLDGKLQGQALDDASYLQIDAGAATFSHDSDTDNFHWASPPGSTA